MSYRQNKHILWLEKQDLPTSVQTWYHLEAMMPMIWVRITSEIRLYHQATSCNKCKAQEAHKLHHNSHSPAITNLWAKNTTMGAASSRIWRWWVRIKSMHKIRGKYRRRIRKKYWKMEITTEEKCQQRQEIRPVKLRIHRKI